MSRVRFPSPAPVFSNKSEAFSAALLKGQREQNGKSREQNGRVTTKSPEKVPSCVPLTFAGSVRGASRAMRLPPMTRSQTTNLGVRSSNLFGRANNLLILIQNFCTIFCLLTLAFFGAAPGQHPKHFTVVATRLNP